MPTQETSSATIEKEKRLIKAVAGLASTDDITLNDRGWDSRVYSFGDGRYFFKFPRSEKVQSRYKYEVAAIKFIADLDTDIVAPKILWEHLQNTYFGYEGVQGRSVSTIIEELGTSQKQTIGSVLGDFLKRFHQLQLPDAKIMSLEDESKQIQRWYENCEATVQEYFAASELQRLHALVYEEWPTRLIELGSEPVLCHGDLHFENILLGHDGAVGIIDFGDVAYFDRSKDFLKIEDDTDIFRSVMSAYGDHDTHLKQKIAVRQAMIQILNLGFYAGKGDKASTVLMVEKIRARLAA